VQCDTGPLETLGPGPLALGLRDGDALRSGNCDGRTPGPTLSEPDPSQSLGDTWICDLSRSDPVMPK